MRGRSGERRETLEFMKWCGSRNGREVPRGIRNKWGEDKQRKKRRSKNRVSTTFEGQKGKKKELHGNHQGDGVRANRSAEHKSNPALANKKGGE